MRNAFTTVESPYTSSRYSRPGFMAFMAIWAPRTGVFTFVFAMLLSIGVFGFYLVTGAPPGRRLFVAFAAAAFVTSLVSGTLGALKQWQRQELDSR